MYYQKPYTEKYTSEMNNNLNRLFIITFITELEKEIGFGLNAIFCQWYYM